MSDDPTLNLKPCRCGWEGVSYGRIGQRCWLECPNCGAGTSIRATQAEAEHAWNSGEMEEE